MSTPILFGTDGWRAIIGEEFTFANVRRVSAAVADYALSCTKSPLIVVGYDTRFLSGSFARSVAETLTHYGCRVILSNKVVSTPALSSATVSHRAFGGVMISASHNPAFFNGFKYKTSSGSSAPEAITGRFEKFLQQTLPTVPVVHNDICFADFSSSYFKRLSSVVDLPLIRKSSVSIVADPLYGAGMGYLQSIIGRAKPIVTEIHGHPDPLFGGLHPEPIDHVLGDLKKAVRKQRAHAGLATDGDADRIGVVDDRGRYLTPHQVFPLLLHYLCSCKGMRGKVVQSISLGYLSERIARDYNLPFEEVSVGFKHIANRIMDQNPELPVLMGGEESGGYGYGNYLPERDGILNSLMIIEMLASTGKTLSRLLKDLEKKYGASCYLRTDIPNPGIPKSDFVKEIKNHIPAVIGGLKVVAVKDYDGIEFVLSDDSWLLLRPSGTEPMIRVYAETGSEEKTKNLILWGKKIVNNCIQ
ncbi:MAG: phosphoglucomutase/phosphomannomutase family protein [Elusimicrobia bacterium]|nr:phosphoglucomutase/phosphomannomutase family protein [Elusimicrobiota bacterium]